MVLQNRHYLGQPGVRGWVDGRQRRQGQGVTNSRDDVLALRILQIIAVAALRTAGGIPGECHAGARVHAEVAEHHGHDVDRGAEVRRNALLAAVETGPLTVPGVENRADGRIQLFPGVLREIPPGPVPDYRLEGLGQNPQVGFVEIEVARGRPCLLRRVQSLVEQFAVHAEDRRGEHRQQAAVGVPGEALRTGLLGQTGNRGVGQTDVEDGVHHPRHRELRARPHRDQQRVVRLPQALAHHLLKGAQVRADLIAQRRGFPAMRKILATGLGRDRKAGRNGKPHGRHLGEIGTLATEKIFQVLVSLVEVVHIAAHGRPLVSRPREHPPRTAVTNRRQAPPSRTAAAPAVARRSGAGSGAGRTSRMEHDAD